MENLNIKIQISDLLNNEQKIKLLKAFDSVKMKDIQQQGIDLLDLDPDKINHYTQAMIGVLRALSVKGVAEAIGSERVNEISGYIEELFNCFRCWGDESMIMLLLIQEIYDYGDQNGEKIDSLMTRL